MPNQNDMEANNETIGTVYFTIEGKQATNVFSLVSAEGDVTKPEPTQPNYNGVGNGHYDSVIHCSDYSEWSNYCSFGNCTLNPN